MDCDKFNELLNMVSGFIQKKDTQFRNAIPAKTKLEIVLRYLATGDSFKSLEYMFRIPKCSISIFLPEVLRAITNVLKSYLQVPRNNEEWRKIEDRFLTSWNFPKCDGAIDGKHVAIKRPPNSVSEFFNYKKTYSIILMALVDADYCFIYVDIGGAGRAGDGAVFRDSTLNSGMQTGTLGIPDGSVIIGDAAFPLKPNLLKPYSSIRLTTKQRVFNYRLSRAIRVVENAFGILAWRFMVFQKPIQLKTETVDEVIWAASSLHNWLRKTAPVRYLPHKAVDTEDFNTGDIINGYWRDETQSLTSIKHQGSNNYSRAAEAVRDHYATYFIDINPLPWQLKSAGVIF